MSGAVQTVASGVGSVLGVLNAPEKAINRAIMGTDFAKDSKLMQATVGKNRSGIQLFQDGFQAIGDGKGVDGAVSATVGRSVKDSKGKIAAVKGGIDGPQEAPATIIAEDPAAVQAEAEKKKARAKRQAEIDILTDRPGRGGTVLTDQYTYNV